MLGLNSQHEASLLHNTTARYALCNFATSSCHSEYARTIASYIVWQLWCIGRECLERPVTWTQRATPRRFGKALKEDVLACQQVHFLQSCLSCSVSMPYTYKASGTNRHSRACVAHSFCRLIPCAAVCLHIVFRLLYYCSCLVWLFEIEYALITELPS